MRVIKQNNKEKMAGIPQQREPVTAGPENQKIYIYKNN